MLAFAPLAGHIPLAALAGVLIVTAVGLIDRQEMARIWRSAGGDRIIMVVTLAATLFLPLQFAVLTGILMSLAQYLLRTSAPRVRTVLPDERFEHLVHQPGRPSCPQLGIIEILGDLYFGAARHVEECIERNLTENPDQRFLLLRMQSIEQIDISGIHALENVLRTYRERGGDLFLTRVRSPVSQVMASSGFTQQLRPDHFLPQDGAVSHLFHKALDPAICIYECPVRAFRECQNLPKSPLVSENGRHSLRLPPVSPQVEAALVSLGPEAVWTALHSPAPPLVVDVREPREFGRGHVPGARSLPLSGLLSPENHDVLAELVREERLVILVCRSGRRSSRVAALVSQRGGRHVAFLRGGMLGWEAAKLLEAVDEIA
jgi:SulP family sulfate permease